MTSETMTEKESRLLDAIKAGGDEPGCGWLFDFGDAADLHGKELSGVVGSLVKKGLIWTEQNGDDYYVGIK